MKSKNKQSKFANKIVSVVYQDEFISGWPRSWWTLNTISCGLKRQAMNVGRFPGNRRTIYDFDNRYKLKIKPFRSIGYNEIVKLINKLESVIKKIEAGVKYREIENKTSGHVR